MPDAVEGLVQQRAEGGNLPGEHADPGQRDDSQDLRNHSQEQGESGHVSMLPSGGKKG